MGRASRYTILAHRHTAKFPTITYVGKQIYFWVIANLLLVLIIGLYSRMISEAYTVPVVGDLGTTIWIAFGLGIINGIGFGLSGYYFENRFFRKLSLGKVILYKAIAYIAIFTLVLMLLRFVMFEYFVSPTLVIAGIRFNESAWDYLFFMLLAYYSATTLIINFINQMNSRYGPGVLVPLLLGQYRIPKEEERVFMFMDLKSSTTIAEKLGHLKYSSFVRDCFSDINDVIYKFYAQIYQYVGDEVVVMWPLEEGVKSNRCVDFYFSVVNQFQRRNEYYISKYGFAPVFKAGMHCGLVTAVEIGEVKRDIAYHGDTLNTAARIQSMCNNFSRDFIVSEQLINNLDAAYALSIEWLGPIELKGKAEKVRLASIQPLV